jgi:BirA family biotin operon repressor/biotin-[acetyl-CoA-carboxylase] ligase
MDTPYEVVHLPTVESTQDAARSRRRGRPLLLVADRQTAGRGRNGAPWRTADRALAASIAFSPSWPKVAWPRLTLAAGLAARDAITRVPEAPEVGLKWPNDLVSGVGKVGGLLAEASAASVVVGLGINLWWLEPIPGAGALFDRDPGPRAARQIADWWAEALLRVAAADPESWPLGHYARQCVTLGRRISWPGGTGRAVGIAPDGGLEVDVDGGLVVLHAGAVREVREPA